VIVSRGGEHLVPAPQHVLPHDVRRHVRIAWLRQIAVRGSANEAAFALRIEPASGLSIGNDGSRWSAGDLLAARRIRLLLRLPLPSSPALVAAASSVVTMVALTGMALLLLVAIALLTAAALWIVLLLLLTAAVARPIGGRSSWRT
jgi:hypothetical protein